jgi:hypothetical protein
MPTNEEPKQTDSIKDQPAVAELEAISEELKPEDAERVAGGVGIGSLHPKLP